LEMGARGFILCGAVKSARTCSGPSSFEAGLRLAPQIWGFMNAFMAAPS
jgi:hypothetical protein